MVIPWKLIGFLVVVGAAIAFDQYATRRELEPETQQEETDDDE